MTSALLDHPLLTAEFLAVDTETNGLPRERCELTEVGAVLVGGGELHERWASLVGVSMPLSPGIQRFTGISQAMVDTAPAPEQVLPELAVRLRGRVLVAHSARFDIGVLRQAFARSGLDWPAPPVLCTIALARRLAPLQRRRGLRALAEALGIEVAASHRALPDAETCARVFCALFKRLCANAPTVGDAVGLLGPRRNGPRRRPQRAAGALGDGALGSGALGSGLLGNGSLGRGAASGRTGFARRPPERRPDLRSLPRGPGVYVFRDGEGRALYVGKSVDVRTRARQHFTAGAEWAGRAEQVDCEPTHSELGALLLEHRLIRALKPPGNTRGAQEPDGYVYVRCRLDIAFPILEVAREPASGHAVCIGPVRGRALAVELVEQLNSLFGLRHCGRALQTRQWPSAYGQMGRCLSPCLGDLDPNLYREQLEAALRLFVDAGDGAPALLAHVDAQMRAASQRRNYERAAALRRRRARLSVLLERLGGVLRAVHTGTRLVLAPHPDEPGRADALWIAGGRVVDWARLPEARDDVAGRTAEALRAAPRPGDLGAWLPAEELGEVRVVGSWLATHPFDVLELDLAREADRVEEFVAQALGARPPTRAGHPRSARSAAPAATSRAPAAAQPGAPPSPAGAR